jgi:alpha-L-arabinofuranosidase
MRSRAAALIPWLVTLTVAAAHIPAVMAGDSATITVRADQPGATISPLLYGIFFEEINRAGDGGIYAEMLADRSFEDAGHVLFDAARRKEIGAEEVARETARPMSWSLVASGNVAGSMALDRSDSLNANNPTSLRLQVTRGGGRVGIANDGFRGVPMTGPVRAGQSSLTRWRESFAAASSGINVEAGKIYELSLHVRALRGAGPITATLEKKDGTVLATQKLRRPGSKWTQVTASLQPNVTDANARLVVSTEQPGTIWLDMISLLPRDTWKGRANGLRSDLMNLVAAMQPAFVRFPGGCFVEGLELTQYPRWQDSIGDIAQRPEFYSIWGYTSTNGLGYHEYLQMSEDLGAEPLFVINAGMSHGDRLEGNISVPMNRMGPYVQDALDAIEYANGPVTSQWGAQRARNGHPKPFNLKFMEIGNENGGPDFAQRYAVFHDAIKARYPEIKLVVPEFPDLPGNRPIDIADPHFYGSSSEQLLGLATHFDSHDRAGPKIYVGEYAVINDAAGRGNLEAAVAEAAFLAGLERNGDIVMMSSYAPLFIREGWQRWNPNAIVFDQARAYGTPSYHVQTMFAANRADRVLPVAIEQTVQAVPINGMIGVGTWHTSAEFKDIKVTRGDQTLFASDFAKEGSKDWNPVSGDWKVVDGVLQQTSLNGGTRALIGAADWSDYTITLKARSLRGREGFVVFFGTTQDGKPRNAWNLGGWSNKYYSLETTRNGQQRIPGSIETGRWYDVRIATQGGAVKAYLDGKLVQSSQGEPLARLNAVAGRDDKTGEVIVKISNSNELPVQATLQLQGLPAVPLQGHALVLAGPARDENSFDRPLHIAPHEETVNVPGPRFMRELPAQSVTVLRLKSR